MEIDGYTIVDRIGGGAMGTVYRAHQQSIGRDVAIKVLKDNIDSFQDDHVERFTREVRLLASIQHPNILTVHDFGVTHSDRPYIVMTYIEGGTLKDYIRQQMDLDEIGRILNQVADALDTAHQYGIIHRDMKPDNVLMDAAGNAYLADFGLAVSGDSKRLTASGGLLGTPHYMAPELAIEDDVVWTADVYALGVMLYEMLVGKVPYDGPNPMAVLMAHVSRPIPDILQARPDLPPALRDVVTKGLAKDPQQRYQSANELAEAFEAVYRDSAHPSQVMQRQRPPQEEAYYLNAWARGLFFRAEETLGKQAFQTVLMQAGLGEYINNYPPDNMRKEFPFSQMHALWCTMLTIYGDRGLQSVGKHAGYNAFYDVMEHFSAIAKAARAMITAATPQKRYLTALKFMQNTFNSLSDQNVEAFEHEGDLYLRVGRCLLCEGCQAERPMGHFYVGNLSAVFDWMEGTAENVTIREVRCKAQGDDEGLFRITLNEH